MAGDVITGPHPRLPPADASPPFALRQYADRLGSRVAEGDLEGALQEVERGLVRFPASVELWLHRARLYARLGDPARAGSAYEAVMVLDPGNAEATDHFVGRARARGDHAEAVRWLSRRLEVHPTDAETYARRALAFRFCDQPRAAACDAALAIVLHPEGEPDTQLAPMYAIVAGYVQAGAASVATLHARLRQQLATLPGDRTAIDRRADRVADLLDASAS